MIFKSIKALPLILAVRTQIDGGWMVNHPSAVLAHGNVCLFPKKGGGTASMSGYMLDIQAGNTQVKMDVTQLLETLASQRPDIYMTYVTKEMLNKYINNKGATHE